MIWHHKTKYFFMINMMELLLPPPVAKKLLMPKFLCKIDMCFWINIPEKGLYLLGYMVVATSILIYRAILNFGLILLDETNLFSVDNFPYSRPKNNAKRAPPIGAEITCPAKLLYKKMK